MWRGVFAPANRHRKRNRAVIAALTLSANIGRRSAWERRKTTVDCQMRTAGDVRRHTSWAVTYRKLRLVPNQDARKTQQKLVSEFTCRPYSRWRCSLCPDLALHLARRDQRKNVPLRGGRGLEECRLNRYDNQLRRRRKLGKGLLETNCTASDNAEKYHWVHAHAAGTRWLM